MSLPVTYCENRATVAQVAKHLHACDADFVPPLSTRVQIDGYASKLTDRAVRFEAWAGESLIGLVAAYCDGSSGDAAFVSSVSTLASWRGQGIAGRLMRRLAAHVRAAGFSRLTLEVERGDPVACGLYERLGFLPCAGDCGRIMMELKLRGELK